ncbi:hypothetical protein VFPPC_08435 [Pochonia chlamydosporia 170]|uniref:Uncharacterized protein n=1 Tax=Pochonia chlamydosporia 170 TaxID=1380566 RepID=A0A179FNT7_METCM|nr:hypothetical protein VFPPC_08435 [Pochonia chlamydosporia 170]OAQ66948.1 hypothetical protein VFPPC_08435 [Pochonia chlamydosporia 170]
MHVKFTAPRAIHITLSAQPCTTFWITHHTETELSTMWESDAEKETLSVLGKKGSETQSKPRRRHETPLIVRARIWGTLAVNTQ